MIPQGTWIVSNKPAPPPQPKKPFDVFWEALGKFVKKTVIYGSIAIILFLTYFFGYSQRNLIEFLQDSYWFTNPLQLTTQETAVAAIPGQKLYSVIVDRARTEIEARAIINRLRTTNIVASHYFAGGQYVIYIGNLSTIAKAENALAKVWSMGFGNARIVP